MVINHLLTGMVLQVGIRPTKASMAPLKNAILKGKPVQQWLTQVNPFHVPSWVHGTSKGSPASNTNSTPCETFQFRKMERVLSSLWQLPRRCKDGWRILWKEITAMDVYSSGCLVLLLHTFWYTFLHLYCMLYILHTLWYMSTCTLSYYTFLWLLQLGSTCRLYKGTKGLTLPRM